MTNASTITKDYTNQHDWNEAEGRCLRCNATDCSKLCPEHRPRNRARIPEIKLPDTPGKTAHTIIGKHILFVEVAQDDRPENPCTSSFDGVGSIRSLSRRHINNIGTEEAVELLKDADVVPLSYFEHGQSLWMVQELPVPAGVEFQWDGVRFAGIWIPDDSLRECVGPKYLNLAPGSPERRAHMVEYAKQACTTYTQWVNGEVYGYVVEVYALRTEGGDPYTAKDDYRKLTPVYEDSCWGHFGWDYAVSEAVTAVRSGLRAIGFSIRAISAALKEVKS